MKNKICLWQFVGFVLTSIFGTLLHFLYDWTGESVFVAPFSGVNESTWEHMKLLYFPLLAFAFIESRYFKEYKSFWCVKLCGILSGLLTIPVLFYTYNGAIGKSPDWLNITIFFISAAVSFLIEAHLFNREKECRYEKIAFSVICLMGVLFVLFTFKTPKLPVFRDPLTGVYGLNV